MSYSVDCSCGMKHPVSAVHAGGTLICNCGTTVQVPALSELRRIAGQSSYPVSVADKLVAMDKAGELPVEQPCVRCGIGTKSVLPCSLVCETAYVKRSGFFSSLALWWISPLAALYDSKAADNAEPHGRDVTVPTPLRICGDCVSQVRNKKKLIFLLLQKTPAYSELLSLYPHAELLVDE